MEWVPSSAWLTKLRVDSTVSDLNYDLAVDASGAGRPSHVAAGLEPPTTGGGDGIDGWPITLGTVGGFGLLAFVSRRRSPVSLP